MSDLPVANLGPKGLFNYGQCKTQTADCRLETGDREVKCRLRVKCRLQTRDKMQTEGKIEY